MDKKQTIIFDGDDTLWKTQPIYRSVIDEFYRKLREQGFKSPEVRPVFTSINRKLLKEIKLSSKRLGLAMSGAYEAMCQKSGVTCQTTIVKELLDLSQQVYIRPPEPMEGVHEVLSSLKQNFQLIFYSGGVEETQVNRLKSLSLDHYFGDRVFVVDKKDEETLGVILQSCGLRPDASWMVGNSPKFEMIPALRLGLSCIWMHTSFWKEELESITLNRVFVAFDLNEVENILLFGNGFGAEEYLTNSQDSQIDYPQLIESKNVWIIGNNPKNDINPAIKMGANPIWIPTNFNSNDIEPFLGSIFVAFNHKDAESIIKIWADKSPESPHIIRRIYDEQGDKGGSLIVE